jgi:hypothetical protein
LTSVELARQWGTAPAGLGSAIADAKRLHQELLDWARRDDELRRWIVGSWREAHAEVVAAADQAAIEGLLGDAVRLLNAFPLQETLLALLTDEFDDGRKLARTFVSQIEDDCERRELSGVLNCVLGENSDLSPRRVRVVILGGHQRDESKLADRLFENSPFEVRWRTFEKRAGSGLVQKKCGQPASQRGWLAHHHRHGQPYARAIRQGCRATQRHSVEVH